MKDENRIWKSKFLGKLDMDSSMFSNANKEMQFRIKIISSGPSDFPYDTIKTVTGFSDSLKKFGYYDSGDEDEASRQKKITDTLDKHYLIFSVKESEHSNPEFEKKYFNATDLMLISKEKMSNQTNNFEILPLFTINKGNLNDFIEKIKNEEYLGKNDSISYHPDDLPPFLFISESSDFSLNDTNDVLYAIGPFKKFHFNDEYGVKFVLDDSLKLININKTDIIESYSTREGAMFITPEDYSRIESELFNSENILKLNEEVKSFEEFKKIENVDEANFLKKFQEVCLDNQLVYEIEDLYNFHTAMKTKSFVILAGMSGTGKSQLIQCYHEALYQSKSNENLLFIPVSPSWQDDSDLLGYLDTLNSVYRPADTGLIDFIINSQQKPDECFIICLDEMNLSKVEHYFSQFLSILERNSGKRYISLYNPNVENRIFNKNDYPAKLELGNNLFITGTINTDESTFSFSDKVLDRSNVINISIKNFIDVKKDLANNENRKKNESIEKPNNNEATLTFKKFQGMKKNDDKNKLTGRELNFLWELHNDLNNVNPNIGIGMRILNQIEEYIVNLPESNVLNRKDAFDLQLSQRIFTKLRGSSSQLHHLVGTISEDGTIIESKILKLFESYSDISKFARSIKKLEIVAKELSEYGHTI